ncbi:radial spoke head protein 4 homolog A-like [Uloborus diversus]|uniref:radial spoke head protein 4 homolog A-like n=1 Tax=Uloborus diversus TaxID=327109 RepID=UPI0024098A71|nr:radial spoke head protein 4 homolog A-like [Uloborus diversus]
MSLDNEEEKHSLYKPENFEKQAKASENEVGAAKAFLSVVDQKTKISLYDHILSILRVVLRSKLENAVEEFEDISLELKRKKTETESEFREVILPDERVKKLIENKKQFLKLEQQDIVEVKSNDDDDDDEENEDDDDADQNEEKGEEKDNDESVEENEEEDTENEEKSPPPIPEPKQKKKKTVPAEEAGTGVNQHLYFVCSEIGKPWRCLPLLKPFHIVEARQLKRYLTGNLEDEIRGCVIFDGKEAHYLRAQIARISSCTFISPESFYTLHSEADEDDENEQDDNEDNVKKSNEILKNKQYETKNVKELFSRGLEGWVHSRPAILDQGRCTPMSHSEEEKEEEENADEEEKEKDDAEDEEGDDEKDDDEIEIFEAIRETSVPLLRTIADDKAIGRLDPWIVSLSSKLLVEKAIIILRSNLWPGAYTFYDGKIFDHIYIGYGFKYSAFHYAPPIYVPWQKEYKVDTEVIEHVDEPFALQTEETNVQKNSDEETEDNKEEEE